MHSKKAGWVVLAAAVASVLTVLLVRQPIGRFVLGRTLLALGRALHGSIVAERVEGDVFSDLRLINVTATAGRDSARAACLAVKYDFLALLTGRIVLREVEVVGPEVFVAVEREPLSAESVERPFPRLVIQRLAVSRGRVFLGDRPRVDSLALVLSMASNRVGMRLQLDSACWRMVDERLAVTSFTGIGLLTRDSLVITQLAATTAKSRLSGMFRFGLHDRGAAAEIDSLRLELEEVIDVPGQIWLRGTAMQRGETRRVYVTSTAEGLRWRDIRFPRLTGQVALEDSTVSLKLSGASEDLGVFGFHCGLRVGNMAVRGGFETKGLAVSRLEPQMPEFRLDARCEFGGVLAGLRPERGRDSLDVFVNGRIAELGVDSLWAEGGYRAGAFQLRRLETSGRAGRLSFAGLVRRNGVRADCRFESLDVAVIGKFAGLEMGGCLSGHLRAEGARGTWNFDGLLTGSGISGPGVTLEDALAEIDMRLEIHPRETPAVTFDGRLAIGGEGVSISGIDIEAGQFIYTGPEFNLRLDRVQDRLVVLGSLRFAHNGLAADIDTIEYVGRAETLSARPFTVAWDADSLTVRRAVVAVADGQVTVEAVLHAGRSPEISVRGEALNLRKLQKLLQVETETWGTLDFVVNGAETLCLEVACRDFEVPSADIRLKHIGARADFSRDGVLVRRLGFVHRVDTSVISGTVAYTLSPRPEVGLLDLKVELADPGAWLFGLTRPYVEVRDAQVFGTTIVRGGLRELRFDGRLRVSRADLYVPSIDATVEKTQAEISLDGDQIRIDKLSGRTARGIATVSGIYDLAPGLLVDSLHFLVRFNGAAATPLPDIYAIGGGEVSVSWRPGEQTLIAGRVDVEEALIAMGLGGGGGTAASTEEQSLALDLDIRGDRGIWLRNRDSDIELAVDLRVRQGHSGTVYAGQLASRQGSVYYLDHVLQVTEGVLSFQNIDRFNPDLSITAELPVRNRNGHGPDRILLRLTGTLAHPEFDFTSEPAVWDAGQIVSYLNLNVTADELTAMEQKEAMTRLVTQRLLGYFQTRVARQVRQYMSLDYLEVETGLAGGNGASLTVGKYLGRNLYISYSQSFSSQLQPAFTVQYYLDRRSEILAERSADGRYSLRYQFRLRY